jgi:hypothetical protein
MKFKSLASLVAGIVLALSSQKANPAVTIGYDLCNKDKVPLTTNWYQINVPGKIGVWLDSTTEPNTKIRSIDWDIGMPNALGYTNFMKFDGSSLPNHDSSEDFFNGFTMDSGMNRIDSSLNSSGVLDDNVRGVLSADGPTNRKAYIGWYDFTPEKTATNKLFGFPSVSVYNSSGNAVTCTNFVRPRFNIIPEPGVAGNGLGALANLAVAYGLMRERFRNRSKNIVEQYEAQQKDPRYR